ncbi:MAG: urea ABC transporter permease subunit UrtB [Alphaproteobacteria bacterium]|nr:urea ABC transporter permease subunit UrtB [Alphaproteobacteria bacterium]
MNFIRTFLAGLLVVLAAAMATPAPVSAGELEDRVKALDAKNFAGKGKAIEALEALADPAALPVLRAMQEGLLFREKATKRIVIGVKAARSFEIFDALSGEALGVVKKRKLKKISVNNRLRGRLRLAIGALALTSGDAAARSSAAKALVKDADPTILPALDRALAREQEVEVAAVMGVARAAIQAKGGEKSARLAAISALEGVLDREVMVVLGTLSQAANEPDAEIRALATETLAATEASGRYYGMLETLFFGVSLGSVLLLAAIGLAITFGVMGVINMAHGEMIMLGAYTTYVIQQVFPGAIEYSLAIAVPVAFLVSGAVGVVLERSVIRFLYGRPLETLLATFGISLVLQQAVRSIFSPLNRSVITPDWMSGALEVNAALSLTYNRLTIIIFTFVLLLMIAALLRYSSFGLRMRAVTQNRAMASAMGIRTNWVDALTFGFGSGIAGIAGVALSQLTNVGPNLGQQYIVDSFMVVVFGGVGNIWGTTLGAMTLGIANKVMEPWSGAVLGKILILVFIILFIQKRPSGMFALKGRAAEN